MTTGTISPSNLHKSDKPADAAGNERAVVSSDDAAVIKRMNKYRKRYGAALDESVRQSIGEFFGKRK